MKVIGIIPARIGSSRLPNKPLKDLAGKPLIQRVYENALTFGLAEIIVATDSQEIVDVIEKIGGRAEMTPSELPSGTYRCAYLAENLEADVVINIQGDEPFLLKSQVSALIKAFEKKETDIATLCYHLQDAQYLSNAATVKVVMDNAQNALYFSRSAIPFVRNFETKDWVEKHQFYKHIGVYAFRKDVLLTIAKYSQSELEQAESLEQLTWLANGHKIKMVETPDECMSIDTNEDLQKAIAYLKRQ